MANREKYQHPLPGTTWKIRLDHNTIGDIEEILGGRSILELIAGGMPSVSTLRAALLVGATGPKGTKLKNKRQAGLLLEEVGFLELTKLLADGVASVFTSGEDALGEGEDDAPLDFGAPTETETPTEETEDEPDFKMTEEDTSFQTG
jgi:hypothetical protein